MGVKIKEACKESQINISLLGFCPTKEKLLGLGKAVWEVLNRKEQRREYVIIIDGKKYKLYCQEVVIHGT